jgi:hypothetical protein
MSLLDDASLLVTPNAEKATKLYSIIPTNGNGDFSVTRATTKTRTNSSGLVVNVPINEPALDYSLGSCSNILLEPQRTNLMLRSEEFNDATWSKAAASVTANSTTSPSGLVNADTITSTAVLTSLTVQLATIVSGTTYTTTFYVKQNTQRFIYIRFTSQNQAGNYVSAVFDLQDGTIGQTSVGTISGTLISTSVTAAANGFYRISLTASINRTDGNFGLGFATAKTGNIFNTSGSIISAITLGNSFFAWGAQLEAGAYATSYIPTTSASVTRNGDVISRGNIFTNGLITASGGTWFVDLRNNLARTRDAQTFFGVGDTLVLTTNSLVLIPGITAGRYLLFKAVGGSFTSLYTTLTDTAKIAIKWNGTNANVFVNGVKVVTNTAFTTTNMQFLNNTGAGNPININSMALFPTALTDSQCIALTT